MIKPQWINITIGVLAIVLIILIVWGMIFQPKQNNSTTTGNNTTQTGGDIPTPTLIAAPSPTYPPLPNTQLGKVKGVLLVPQKYKDITLEYKPKSDTIVIYYNGEETGAQAEFNEFLQSVQVDDQNIKTYYMSLDPISLPPPNL